MRTVIAPLALSLALATSPAAAQGIVPLDGMWTTRAQSVDFADSCPDEVMFMMEAMADAMQGEDSEEITFGGTFDPAKMADAETENVTWTRIDENSWAGEMTGPDRGEPVAQMTVTAIAEDRIEGSLSVDMAAMLSSEPEMITMAIAAQGCTLDMRMISTHDG